MQDLEKLHLQQKVPEMQDLVEKMSESMLELKVANEHMAKKFTALKEQSRSGHCSLQILQLDLDINVSRWIAS